MEKLMEITASMWAMTTEMAPYLLLGFLAAGLLSVLVSPEIVEKHLGGRGMGAILKASIFGIPLPLCSCSVVPVAASLRRHGASKGAVASFMLSTPQTGVDSIFATFSLLGPIIAIFRPVAALVTGLTGGALVDLFSKRGGAETPETPAKCEEECCSGTGKSSKAVRALRYGLVTLPNDLAVPMLAGLLVAGLIAVMVPADFVKHAVGGGIGAMLIMMALGIPMYVCATASVPIAAAMIAKGVSPGAALVFLIAGPGTNAATLTVVWKMLGARSAVVYLATLAILSIAAGLILDLCFDLTGVAAVHAGHDAIPEWFKILSTVLLLAVLFLALLRRIRDNIRHGKEAHCCAGTCC